MWSLRGCRPRQARPSSLAPRLPPMTTGLLVTGTDTGVGKTVVAVALLRGLVAHRHRTSIDIDRIADAYGRLARRADVVIVEGAGGALVPLNDRLDVLDIA